MPYLSLKKTLLSSAFLLALSLTSLQAKTFIYCSESAPEGFDPALYTTNNTWDASSETIYDRLIEFKPGTTEVTPGLATQWQASDDGLEYTFSLRRGVKFHSNDRFTPTRDFNADDVLFTYHRQMDKDNPWYNYTETGNWFIFEGMEMPDTIKEIIKIDDYQVRFVLNQPDVTILAKLALNYGAIMSKEYADQLEADGRMGDLDIYPIGTGPFYFVTYQNNAAIRYAAHEDYWAGKPKIDDLVFAITIDPAVRIQRLRAGECHMAPYPLPADLQALENDPNIEIQSMAGLNIAYMAYNTTQAPFDNPQIRHALNMAINRQAIIDGVYQNMGQIAKGGIPPAMWGYDNTLEDIPFDPERARQMLEEAEALPLKMKIWAMPVSRPYMPNARRTAELMQADLAKIGVEAEVISYEWGEYLKRAREPDRDGAVILGATSDYGDPDDILGYFFTCSRAGNGSNTNWCNREVETALQQARITADSQARSALYHQVQREIHAGAPWLPIAHSTVVLPMSKKVKNYVMEPLGMHRFKNVDLEE